MAYFDLKSWYLFVFGNFFILIIKITIIITLKKGPTCPNWEEAGRGLKVIWAMPERIVFSLLRMSSLLQPEGIDILVSVSDRLSLMEQRKKAVQY